MNTKETNQLDTYDTLKYGHVPLKHLFEYAIEILNFKDLKDRLEYDDCDVEYCYTRYLNLLWSADSYNLTMTIGEPDDLEDRENVVVTFYCNLQLDKEEKRLFPIFDDLCEEFQIKTRDQFVEAILYWKTFVGKSIVQILEHRLEMLSDLDEIVKREKDLGFSKDSLSKMKQDYHYWLSILPVKLAHSVNELLNFTENGETIHG